METPSQTLDAIVKRRLRQWPQTPPGLTPRGPSPAAWLRGRPTDDVMGSHPFLKVPGSEKLRTLPDGLWLNFAGSTVEPFVDIFAIEACGTLQNLLDKRARFAPSTHSLLAVCPIPWLLAPISATDPTPRWRATCVISSEPSLPFVLPVRDIRVMYGLKRDHYIDFARHQVPHAHEFFVPMHALVAQDSDKDPAMQALIARASAASNFLMV
ncbi:MAG: hypothetical protein KGL12_09595 [Rhodospirillales bacterium]|nr:hypothetical protein [Rhodospirillales bacterium]